MLYKIFTHFFIFLIIQLPIWGQVYDFESVSLEEGLSQSSINAVEQDRRGFLWVGTQVGLNRYDGYGFKIFKKEAFDSTSLATNFITSLLIDSDENLWVGTLSGGLHLYLPENESFIRFYNRSNDSRSIIHDNITTLHQDSKGNLWVGTAQGICRIFIFGEDGQPKVNFSALPYPSELTDLLPSDRYIRTLFSDDKNRFWVGTLNGLFCFDFDENFNLKFRKKHFPKQKIKTVTADTLGNIWVGTKSGLYQFFEEESSFDLFEDLKVNEIKKLQNGDLAIGSESGLSILKFENGQCLAETEKVKIADSKSGRTIGVNRIWEDRVHPNLIWLGTPVSGLQKMEKRIKQFESGLPKLSPKTSVSPSVKNILKDSKGKLWMTVDEGILKYKANTQKYGLKKALQTGDFFLPANRISRFWRDWEGNIWSGSFQYGLFQLADNQVNAIRSVQFLPLQNCEDNAVLSFLETETGYLVGTFSGLNFLDKKTGEFPGCPIVFDSLNYEKLNYRVNEILLDKNQNLWVGTSYGLVIFEKIGTDFPRNLINQKPLIFRNDSDNPKSLIDNDIQHLFEDSKGNIWLGTNMGLVKVTLLENDCRFKVFNTENGLANAVIYGILEDEKNEELWLSTNGGLARFDPKLEHFFNFDVNDGLQSNEFNAYSCFKADDGEMYFGGVNGYTHFYPDAIQLITQPPPVWITNLTTQDGQVFNLLTKENYREVTLGYRQNSFSISFVGIDFQSPNSLLYFYDLEGGGAQNVPIGNSRRVNFSNLKPGVYSFRIRALSKDRALNFEGDKLTVRIVAPFWQRAWFFVLLIIAFGWLIWLIFHIRYLWKVKRLAEIERVRKDAAADFHDELGSKLSIISMYGELTRQHLKGKDGETEKYLGKVIETSNNLYGSMKDLLWALNPDKDSLEDLFFLLKGFGNELFADSDIIFSTNRLPKEMRGRKLPMQVKRHVLLIFKEAMNNVLKHSNAKKTRMTIHLERDILEMELNDNGVGFNPNKKTSGEGLKNMRSRAYKISAALMIDSDNKGTSIRLVCPLKIKQPD